MLCEPVDGQIPRQLQMETESSPVAETVCVHVHELCICYRGEGQKLKMGGGGSVFSSGK